MEWALIIIGLSSMSINLVLGGLIFKMYRKNRDLIGLEREFSANGEVVASLRESLTKTLQEKTMWETKCEGLEEKIRFLQENETKLMTTFKALSADALSANSATFMQLAKGVLEGIHEKTRGDFQVRQKSLDELVTPLKASLQSLDGKLAEVEKIRLGAYEGLKEQIKGLSGAQSDLKRETLNLVQALRTPHVRGRWGEMQLRRVVEMAGMLAHCDFFEQKETISSEFKKSRPDMVVRLPGNKIVIIDAKVPLMAFLDSLDTQDVDVRKEKLKTHARHVRTHIQNLSQRAYWDQFKHTPEFVVLFLPGESFFSAALDEDPSLIEMGVEHKVILATPTTLISLLRTISYGWRQETLSENAQKIAHLGHELYKRLADMEKHFTKVGKAIAQASEAYNETYSRYEHKVIKTARKFEALKTSPVELDRSIEAKEEVIPEEGIPSLIEKKGNKKQKNRETG